MTRFIITCLFSLLACSATILGKRLPLVPGKCLQDTDLPAFKPHKFFVGHWYEYASFGDYIFQADGTCRSMETEIRGDVLDVIYYQYQPLLKKYTLLRSSTNVTQIVGSSFVLDYKLLVGLIDVKVPLTVLATDYSNYAVLYSCQESIGLKSESSWLMTRHRGDNSFHEDFVDIVTSSGLNYNDYDLVPSTECGSQEPSL